MWAFRASISFSHKQEISCLILRKNSSEFIDSINMNIAKEISAAKKI